MLSAQYCCVCFSFTPAAAIVVIGVFAGIAGVASRSSNAKHNSTIFFSKKLLQKPIIKLLHFLSFYVAAFLADPATRRLSRLRGQLPRHTGRKCSLGYVEGGFQSLLVVLVFGWCVWLAGVVLGLIGSCFRWMFPKGFSCVFRVLLGLRASFQRRLSRKPAWIGGRAAASRGDLQAGTGGVMVGGGLRHRGRLWCGEAAQM